MMLSEKSPPFRRHALARAYSRSLAFPLPRSGNREGVESLRDRRKNGFNHAVKIPLNLNAIEAQGAIATREKPGVAPGVARYLGRLNA